MILSPTVVNMHEYISDIELRRQAWKYYAVPIFWIVYTLFLPWAWTRFGPWPILLMVIPGAWLYAWLSYLMHESWHRYVPNVNNDRFLKFANLLLGCDPQLYRLVHGYHHSRIHTWDDTEFHPIGRIPSRPHRALYNTLEIVFGLIFIFALLACVVPRHPRYRDRYSRSSSILAFLCITLIYGTIGLASALTFGLAAPQVLIPWAINFWICAFVVHQDQMIQHGGIIVDGDLDERNLATRNFPAAGPVSRFILFLLHSDPREHVLHHTMVRVHHRPFPGRVPLPENAVYISPLAYVRVLAALITGKE